MTMNAFRFLPALLLTPVLALASPPESVLSPVPPTDTASTAEEMPDEAEDDFAALYGTSDATHAAVVADPWERYNRRVHRFNLGVDRTIARPLAVTYVNIVPQFARTGVRNFFSNLSSPVTLVNQALQGRGSDAWDTLGRFLINTTVGVGGLFDPASAGQVPKRNEDFGQTLGVWGWRQSRYVELPFFGPRTVRDVLGMGGDMPLSPVRQINDDVARIGLQGLSLVDTRVKLLAVDDMRASAVDEYAMTRDAWLQRRNFQITQDLDGNQDDGFIPIDAMPIPDFGN